MGVFPGVVAVPALVLGLLAEEPRHGYAICKAIRERSPEALKIGEGTIYPLLYRLEQQGRIRGRWETGPGGKPRKVYRVTASGRKMLKAHKTDWQLLSRAFREFCGEGWAET